MSSIGEIFKKYHDKIPPLDLELILENALKKSRSFIIAHPELALTKSKIRNLKSKICRRLKGEPLAYILSHKEFYGLDFKVNKNVLIPRPETELMVEEAMRKITDNRRQTTKNGKQTAIIDIGTGSGCVIITLAKLLSQLSIVNCQLFATDISKKALAVARKNVRLHGVERKIKFFHGNLLEPILKSKILNLKSKIIILANLPYLTPAQIKKSPTIKYEPRLALKAGKDGLKYYRRLLKQIKNVHKSISPHKSAFSPRLSAFLEIDPSQASKIKQLIKKELPHSVAQTKKDLRGHNRIVIIKIE